MGTGELTDPAELERVAQVVGARVDWLDATPPCRTFSKARRKDRLGRSPDRPEGNDAIGEVREANA